MVEACETCVNSSATMLAIICVSVQPFHLDVQIKGIRVLHSNMQSQQTQINNQSILTIFFLFYRVYPCQALTTQLKVGRSACFISEIFCKCWRCNVNILQQESKLLPTKVLPTVLSSHSLQCMWLKQESHANQMNRCQP